MNVIINNSTMSNFKDKVNFFLITKLLSLWFNKSYLKNKGRFDGYFIDHSVSLNHFYLIVIFFNNVIDFLAY